jgi:hypothetical protein
MLFIEAPFAMEGILIYFASLEMSLIFIVIMGPTGLLMYESAAFIYKTSPNLLAHSYDILGARMLWKPKEARKFVKIR